MRIWLQGEGQVHDSIAIENIYLCMHTDQHKATPLHGEYPENDTAHPNLRPPSL